MKAANALSICALACALLCVGCVAAADGNVRLVTTEQIQISPTPAQPVIAITPEPIPEASPSPYPAPEAGKIIAIDAGHQAKRNKEPEPIGPGASETKAKVSSGTAGVSTGVAEFELNLIVSFKLKEELTARGYQVYMIRETNDVDISNKERSELAREAGADIFVRIHANGSENPDKNGIMMVVPGKDSPYVPLLYEDSRRLGELMLKEMLSLTEGNSAGIWETNTMSGINWSDMPVVLVEMGYMSNPEEDERMQEESYQNKLVNGMANGIDRYFEE